MAAAIDLVDQRVAFSGFSSSVLTMTRSTSGSCGVSFAEDVAGADAAPEDGQLQSVGDTANLGA
ncbi:hypothetical protein AB0A94_31880 [Streptomyces sp. NPDC044984]|uniref:hypothetical protein n=1 Tax=Streptomyces sp. NPDC044984 TaxID=3154335 RepID=UPI0033CC1F1D